MGCQTLDRPDLADQRIDGRSAPINECSADDPTGAVAIVPGVRSEDDHSIGNMSLTKYQPVYRQGVICRPEIVMCRDGLPGRYCRR